MGAECARLVEGAAETVVFRNQRQQRALALERELEGLGAITQTGLRQNSPPGWCGEEGIASEAAKPVLPTSLAEDLGLQLGALTQVGQARSSRSRFANRAADLGSFEFQVSTSQ